MNLPRSTYPLLLLAGFAACDSSHADDLPPPMVVTGGVEFLNVEGGCFVFHGDDGNDYNLFAEPAVGLEPLLENGAWLEVEMRLRPELSSMCPGELAEVLRVLSASLPLFEAPESPWLHLRDRDGAQQWTFVSGSGR
jgi:hypothetical protein